MIGSSSPSQFGYKVQFNPDGNLLVVSAIYKSFGTTIKRAGSVILYRYNDNDSGDDDDDDDGSSSWIQVGQELKGKENGDWFGSSIALLQEEDDAQQDQTTKLHLAVGATGRNNGHAGYVQVFELSLVEEKEG
uniref:Uncharacterized protein n=1 Tax=Grammatophora oceanica TaxID=210454 RepID=A0A7S1V327_9STRA